MNRDIIWIERKKTIDIMDQMSSVGLFVYLPLLILCRRNNAMNWWENSCNNKKCEYVCIYPYMASVSPTAILIRIDLWFFDSFQFISRVKARSTNKLFILWPKNNSNEEIIDSTNLLLISKRPMSAKSLPNWIELPELPMFDSTELVSGNELMVGTLKLANFQKCLYWIVHKPFWFYSVFNRENYHSYRKTV